MARYMRITLEQRGVSCVARLLDEEAPDTCELVWANLPQGGDAVHAKYASNEVYCLVPAFAGDDPGLENSTVVPIPGDVVYFNFAAGVLPRRVREELGLGGPSFVDLAIFYGRNNFLFNPATGFVPGNVYATIEENLAQMAAACQDVWRAGAVGERLVYSRVE